MPGGTGLWSVGGCWCWRAWELESGCERAVAKGMDSSWAREVSWMCQLALHLPQYHSCIVVMVGIGSCSAWWASQAWMSDFMMSHQTSLPHKHEHGGVSAGANGAGCDRWRLAHSTQNKLPCNPPWLLSRFSFLSSSVRISSLRARLSWARVYSGSLAYLHACCMCSSVCLPTLALSIAGTLTHPCFAPPSSLLSPSSPP